MYYKVVSNGVIVDASEGMNFVKWQEKNRVFLSWEGEETADGIVTSDGRDIYLIEGRAEVEGYETATYTEITAEEYVELREEIDAGGEIPDEGDDDQEPDSEAKTRLQALEEQVAELSQTNWMLIECLLEMSEIVYGGDLL